jgi:NAD(P)H dehydrogenase (quinone)
MNILYIYAHPHLHSFNGMLYQEAQQTLSALQLPVVYNDLYTNKFNPTASETDFTDMDRSSTQQYFLAQHTAYHQDKLSADIKIELEKVAAADHIILQFPLWWFSMPAILKGWLDRILVKGFAYDSGKVFAAGLLKNKTASVVVSTQSPASAYQLDGQHGVTMDNFLLPLYHTLRFVGIEIKPAFITYGAYQLAISQQDIIKQQYNEYLCSLFVD